MPSFSLPPPEPLILLLALLLDWLAGDMRWLFRIIPHPVVIVGRLIGFFDRKLNREGRGSTDLAMRGAFVTVAVTGLAAGFGWLFHRATLYHPQLWLFEVFLVGVLLAQRSLAGHVAAVGKALAARDEPGARAALRHIVSRDPDKLDRHGVARSALESLAENFSDAVVAPAFWYLLLGLPGLCAYKAINTLDSMIGYKTDRYRWFGMAAARLDDAVNWPAARLSGLILVLAAVFTPKGRPALAWRTMIRDARKHASPNAGWPEGAMAGAFDMALGGPRHYPGGLVETVWIGEGRARLEAADIRSGVTLFTIGCGLLWLGSAVLLLLELRAG